MIYVVLFCVNQTPRALRVDTSHRRPNQQVIDRAELAYVPQALPLFDECVVAPLKLLKDRANALRPETLPVVEEEQLVKWVQGGCGVFAWEEVFKRERLPHPTSRGMRNV